MRGEEDLLDMDTHSFLLRPSYASLPAMKSAALPAAAATPAQAGAGAAGAAAAAAATAQPDADRVASGEAEAKPEEAMTPPAANGVAMVSAATDGVAAQRDGAEPAAEAGVEPPQADAQPQKAQTRLDPKYYSSPGAAPFKIRGKNYLTDRWVPPLCMLPRQKLTLYTQNAHLEISCPRATSRSTLTAALHVRKIYKGKGHYVAEHHRRAPNTATRKCGRLVSFHKLKRSTATRDSVCVLCVHADVPLQEVCLGGESTAACIVMVPVLVHHVPLDTSWYPQHWGIVPCLLRRQRPVPIAAILTDGARPS